MIPRICFLFLLLIGSSAVAQNAEPVYGVKDRFISSLGLSFPRPAQSRFSGQLYGIGFSPSLNLLNKFSDFSVSLSSHLVGAYHPKSSDEPSYTLISFPACLGFNVGHLATHNFYSSLGFSIGGGYNFSVIRSEFDIGPLLITAIHFWFLKRSFTVAYSQTYFKNTHGTMHLLSLQLNVGAYLRDVSNNNKISKFVRPFRK